jgi:polysaccharide export outer membrane protein
MLEQTLRARKMSRQVRTDSGNLKIELDPQSYTRPHVSTETFLVSLLPEGPGLTLFSDRAMVGRCGMNAVAGAEGGGKMDTVADKQTGQHFEDLLRITRIIHTRVASIAKGNRRLPAKNALSFVWEAPSVHRHTSRAMWTSLAICLLTCLLPVSVVAQQSTGKTQDNSRVLVARTGNVVKDVPVSVSADPNYVIGPEDVLDISVWKEPELTRTVPVRPDGKISLPLLSDVQAAGQTPTQLATHVKESLKRYVTDPQVTVIVTAINSQRIYLLGEVTRAGAYPLLPGMTVLQALSSAGGFTPYARTQKIYVLRERSDGRMKLSFNYKDFLNGRNPEQNVVLKVGDTIVVP